MRRLDPDRRFSGVSGVRNLVRYGLAVAATLAAAAAIALLVAREPETPSVAAASDEPSCLERPQTIEIDGRRAEAYAVLCRADAGEWRLVGLGQPEDTAIASEAAPPARPEPPAAIRRFDRAGKQRSRRVIETSWQAGRGPFGGREGPWVAEADSARKLWP
jgi:hypothetical protein